MSRRERLLSCGLTLLHCVATCCMLHVPWYMNRRERLSSYCFTYGTTDEAAYLCARVRVSPSLPLLPLSTRSLARSCLSVRAHAVAHGGVPIDVAVH
jgi:hypothetical protein